MSTRKKKTLPTDPALEVATSLLEFGSELYVAYRQHPSIAQFQSSWPITRHGDYLHHFGFSLEREVSHLRDGNRTYHLSDKTMSLHGECVEWERADARRGSFRGASLAQDTAAEWRLAADQYSRDVGPLKEVESLSELAARLIAPFSCVTWRQNEQQCTLKKVRCIYRWLCDNFHLSREGFPDDADAEGAAPPKKGAAAKAKAPAAPKKKPQKAKQLPESINAPPPQVDPLQLALRCRSATAQTIATLFSNLLACAGVPCEEVDGRLKGLAPEESVEWRWNVVTIHDRQYIVDVAASHAEAFLFKKEAAPRESAEDAAVSDAVNGTRGGAQAPSSTPSRGVAAESTGGTAAGAASPLTPGAAAEHIDAGPSFAPLVSTGTSDFYFFPSPDEFVGTHYPTVEEKSLLKVVPKRVHWDVMPRLTHDFFAYDLQLLSHPRHAAFTVRSAPFYISLRNNAPISTELCCAIYSGTLPQLEASLDLSRPLGSQWVWHQREEATGTETFTLTVPQAGHYTVVIGARPIRSHPYTPDIAAVQQFTPVVFYQAKVAFVPLGAAILPLQILSPAICRLMAPLTSQLLPGTHRFSVMPSCSNVAAVAVVVSCSHPTDNIGGSPLPKRTGVGFLAFDCQRAAFEGDIAVRVGDTIEVWILYGAPDRNGVQLGQRVTMHTEQPPPSVTLSPTQSASNKRSGSAKKKGTPTPPLQSELVYQSLLDKRREGLSFQPFVMGIQVRRFASTELAKVVQPQPTIEMERAATLRRLAGVTSDLEAEAAAVKQLRPCAVGTYFGPLQ